MTDDTTPVGGPAGQATLARMRLDQALALRGLAPSRARARDDILYGRVEVNGSVVRDPSRRVAADDVLRSVAETWVSRGALKLVAALDQFGLDPRGRVALDVGASTGGFTEVLLARGAQRVYAIDVGTGQFHARLKGDARVVLHEQTDARALGPKIVPEPISLIVIDVSFIGLPKVLTPVLACAGVEADLVALVKPQFEVGPEFVGKGGIVRDVERRSVALQSVIASIEEHPAWRVQGHVPSPVLGGDGNQEFLLWARRT